MGEKKKAIRLVFDTNIWVSIALNKSLAEELLPLIRTGQIEVFLSDDLSNELARVLIYPRIAKLLNKAGISPVMALSGILQLAAKIQSGSKSKGEKTFRRVNIVKDDLEDNRVLECALVSRSKLIVSGDKHLLKLKEFRGIKIVRARELFEAIRSQ